MTTITRRRPAATTLTCEAPRPVGQLVALVPAHDEEGQIAATIRSLQGQELAPDRIIVVADNCTDDTVAIAQGFDGVEVIQTQANAHKKAGALNQALDLLRSEGRLGPADAILVMDADSVLEAPFLRTAVLRLAQGDVGAVGGTFHGLPGGGLVGMFQRNEYARYARDVANLQGNVLVLTGTATVFRAGVLDHVRWARANGVIPGGADAVYDTHVLTEDNELTLAILHLGYRIVSPLGARLHTEVMTSWSALAQQRLRWKRGALENLMDYGWTPITRSYWGRQALSLAGILVILAYLGSLVWGLAVTGGVTLHPLWLAVTAIFALERMVTVRSRGPGQVLLAGTIVVEMAYDVFLQLVQARAFVQAATGASRTW
jgi:cellulose synthase/poly-beta-1,6-N-acetylglucosamine synthase-like glycosyltransferase